MQYLYVAQIEAGRVIGVSMLKKENFGQKENQIIIESLDESLLGLQYDSETNAFIQPT
jgi:hypothetical protein